MIKTRWVRNAAIFGTAVTLSLGCYALYPGSADADAASTKICEETEMAGISLSMDKYYIENYAEEQKETESAVATAAPQATAQAAGVTTGAAAQPAAPVQTAAPAPVQTAAPVVGKQFVNMGISVANDYVNVRKKPSTESDILGKLYQGSSAEILEQSGEWVKISSGSVTGYINKDYLAIGAEAEKVAEKYGVPYAYVKKGVTTLNVRKQRSTSSQIVTQIPEDEKYEILGETENWYKIEIDDGERGFVAKEFVHKHVSFKKAISKEEEEEKLRRQREAEEAAAQAQIIDEEETSQETSNNDSSESTSSSSNRSSNSSSNSSSSSSNRSSSHSSSRSSSSRSSSRSSSNSSSSSSRSSRYSSSSSSSNASRSNDGEEESSSNGSSSRSSHYSESSSNSESESSSSSSKGSSIASYACKFTGNPYVWGGSSLTHGTDCSGFTMSIYAKFGYSLPHSAAAQSGRGRSVSFSNLQPGDLIFYRNGGRIGHVALYIGGGQVVHASNKKDGIKISNYRYRQPACARRIIG